MSLNHSVNSNAIFEVTTRDRPLRTYSHKGRNTQVETLPPLKPTVNQRHFSYPGFVHQRLSDGHGKTREEIDQWRELTFQPWTSQREVGEEGEYIDRGNNPRVCGRGEEERSFSSVDSEEDGNPSVFPSDQTHVYSDYGESAGSEGDNDTDENETGRGPNPTSRHNAKGVIRSSSYAKNVRSLRRRPFLIFNKTQPKGYKKVKKRAPPDMPPLSQYRLGDGFSGREAKPIGLNLLTRSGKQIMQGLPIGVLDLTQSAQQSRQKRRLDRADRDDNSFTSVPRMKRSRRSESHFTNQTSPGQTLPAAQSSNAGVAVLTPISENIRSRPIAQEAGQPQDEGIRREKNGPGKTTATNAAHGQGDTALPDAPYDISPNQGRQHATDVSRQVNEHYTQNKLPESWGTHVSETPPCQLRTSPAPSEPSPEQGDALGKSKRILRRFHTQ